MLQTRVDIEPCMGCLTVTWPASACSFSGKVRPISPLKFPSLACFRLTKFQTSAFPPAHPAGKVSAS